ncbi:MAG: RHS repeat-associated core domain-containing protein [Gemmatimonadota bacterium]
MKHDSTVPNRYRYWPFGFPYQRIEGVPNNHTFAGQQSDAESGIFYMRNRFYDHRTRRFISEDPIGLAGGINLYTYADNDPVKRERSDRIAGRSVPTCMHGIRHACHSAVAVSNAA